MKEEDYNESPRVNIVAESENKNSWFGIREAYDCVGCGDSWGEPLRLSKDVIPL